MLTPPVKYQKCLLGTQIFLRICVTAFTLISTCIIFTTKQTVTVSGVEIVVNYSYSPTYKFFAAANIIGCALSALSLFLVSVIGYKGIDPKNYFYMFLQDLIVMALLVAGCAAITAIGWVAKYGQANAGWMAFCDRVAKMCHKLIYSAMLSYIAVIFYLCITIISAYQSRQIKL